MKNDLVPQLSKILNTIIIKKYPFIDKIVVNSDNIDNEAFYYSIMIVTGKYNIEIIDLELENEIEANIRDLSNMVFQSNYDEFIFRKIYSIGWGTIDN